MLEAAWSTGRATTPPPGKGCLPLRCLPLPISPSLHSHFDPLRPPAGCDTRSAVGRESDSQALASTHPGPH